MANQLNTDKTIQFDTSAPTVPGSTTTLAAAITTTAQTAISLTAACGPNGTYIQCTNGSNTERMYVVSGGGTTSPVVKRGAWNTTAHTFATSGTTVVLPGSNTFNLLQIWAIPNQDIRGAKVTSDINYQIVLCYYGDLFPGGASSI